MLTLLVGCAKEPPRPTEPAPIAEPSPVEPPPPPARLWTKGTAYVPVIMYHDVVDQKEIFFDLTTSEFKRQIARLRELGLQPVTLADLVAHLRDGAPLPERPIALTFDDGTPGLKSRVLPLLQEYGYPATFFVHTGYVGVKSPSKDHLTWDELREIEATGLVTVMPHTVTHPLDLKLLSDEQLERELVDSKAAVERELGHPAPHFAFPSEPGDERVAEALEAAGYEAAWNEQRAVDACPADRFALPRFAPKRLEEVISRFREKPPAVTEPVTIGTAQGEAVEWCPTDQFIEQLRRRASHKLLRDGVFRPIGPESEYPSSNLPLVVTDGHLVRLVAFRPWMNSPSHLHAVSDTLELLLDRPTLALAGKAWVIPNSFPSAQSGLRGEWLLAVTAHGQALLGRIKARWDEGLSAELAQLGVIQAGLF